MGTKRGEQFGGFPTTEWSLIDCAQADDLGVRQAALEELLKRYRPALLSHLAPRAWVIRQAPGACKFLVPNGRRMSAKETCDRPFEGSKVVRYNWFAVVNPSLLGSLYRDLHS